MVRGICITGLSLPSGSDSKVPRRSSVEGQWRTAIHVDASIHGLPAGLVGLLQPRAYPHPIIEIKLVETHISWVLLSGEFAYKIKRPVRYPFVDMTSMQRRAYFCREELRLNRRFAPELYLDVCTITAADGEARIGGPGEVIEHTVKMRQFAREDELGRLLSAAQIEPAELEEFGRDLALIHARLPTALPSDAWGQPAAIRAVILDNLEECSRASAIFGQAADVRALRELLERRLAAAEHCMSARLAKGRVRECHGDLHAGNIVRQDSRLIAFDCMEFEPAFRWIDVADEVAFLLADLESQRYPFHAQAFLSGYLAESGDYQACRLLELYKSHRALVRAKVGALKSARADPAYANERQHAQNDAYLDCAQRALAPKRPTLVLICGLSGSGKTWLANRLAPPLHAVHLRSDVERKRLAGVGALAHSYSQVGEGLYSQERSARVYEHLALCAESILAGGYTAIVDATFGRREHRVAFRELALRRGVATCLIHCRAPREVLQDRIVQRRLRGRDASEADVSVLHWQAESWEAIETQEGFIVLEVETAQTDSAQLVERIIALSG